MKITVGNDIVCLDEADEKTNDLRFLNRVFTYSEQNKIQQSPHPHALLWAIWAAKEAAFKSYQQNHLDFIFSPSQCAVEFDDNNSWNDQLPSQATVTIKGMRLSCQWTFNFKLGFIHCLALSTGDDFNAVLYEIKKYTQGCPSKNVRQLAKRLCQAVGINNTEIIRQPLLINGYEKCGPPLLFQSEKPLAHSLSLSHDGMFCAATLLTGDTQYT